MLQLCGYMPPAAQKTLASIPNLEGGMLRLCGYMPPAAQKQISSIPPFGWGNARSF